MSSQALNAFRKKIDAAKYEPEQKALKRLLADAQFSADERAAFTTRGAKLVRAIREDTTPGMMEVFLAEYGLSTDEGIALMCLAEALLRVPDADTIDALIEDKIAPSDWGKHLGESTSSLVNASTWALLMTGKVLDDADHGIIGKLHGAVKRLGEPVIRLAVGRAMKEMGQQFVLGETIEKALKRARVMENKGYSYSYDMLGEAARTDEDARRYHLSYSQAISTISKHCHADDIRKNPGISVKLSALHPRYEEAQKNRVMAELVPRVRSLAMLAKSAGMGFNIDAEEADRLSLSLDVIQAVLSEPSFAGWDGFGVVVQAFGQRTSHTIDWLYALSEKLDRKIMLRLVKGAYWDTEVKLAQVEGIDGFPVFTRKASTDVSYLANAKKLLGMTDRIYPQFATHNAHTVAAILEMNAPAESYEFQRLHGMGEGLHDIVLSNEGTGCRIYAPVGAHRDLLAYLVRRLLENGANSSFVNQIVDEDIPAADVAADPIAEVETYLSDPANPILATGPALFGGRRNSIGWDLAHLPHLNDIEKARAAFADISFEAAPLIHGTSQPEPASQSHNPATGTAIGQVKNASNADVQTALLAASPWSATPNDRAAVLEKAADLYEENFGHLFALLAREAGKTLPDAVGELREAVDFLRYYAERIRIEQTNATGVFTCISPWNFPLAIFTGQVAAALASGNAVIAKPAEQTPIIAFEAVKLLQQAGVPQSVLQYLPGKGSVIGAAITSHPKITGVAFTGSTQTAQTIRKTMAAHLPAGTPLIAETGGLNAMIVDSTALLEQAVQAVVESAFQSAGQRCSALRCIYVQEDIYDDFAKMLYGAMDELRVDLPWGIESDLGPLIDAKAKADIQSYLDEKHGHISKSILVPDTGHFLAPTVIEVTGIQDLEREIFGPVLHLARFKASEFDHVIRDINATGFGLTFGLQTRIDDRVQTVSEEIHAGNIYVNRNQIGAIVGSQPFGGEGLSGTGPKAGGPLYLHRFRDRQPIEMASDTDVSCDEATLQAALTSAPAPLMQTQSQLPGPTGELNQLSEWARPPLLCAGPSQEALSKQSKTIRGLGGTAIPAVGLTADMLKTLNGFGGVVYWGDAQTASDLEHALAERSGAILPLITGDIDRAHVVHERHLCVDTTASGGNAALLADAGDA
ncbi:MAG: bifunctional proline dehydrogenase/L-glutamate gamma-semialdehyde dehydrogenase PutA [Halocynthiibacter sp.]